MLINQLGSGYDVRGKRVDDLAHALYAMFSAIVGLMIALFAYIAWDRRTMLKPRNYFITAGEHPPALLFNLC